MTELSLFRMAFPEKKIAPPFPLPPPPLRTDLEFVYQRVEEAGVEFGDVRTSLGDLTNSLSHFTSSMRGTGCYESVRVIVGSADDEE